MLSLAVRVRTLSQGREGRGAGRRLRRQGAGGVGPLALPLPSWAGASGRRGLVAVVTFGGSALASACRPSLPSLPPSGARGWAAGWAYGLRQRPLGGPGQRRQGDWPLGLGLTV